MTTKVCYKCKVEKGLGEFYRDGKACDGLGSYCKQCNNARKDEWRANNPEKAKENRRTYRAEITDTLADPYIKHLLGTDNPSQELIEHKREQLLMYRATQDLLKTLKDEDNE